MLTQQLQRELGIEVLFGKLVPENAHFKLLLLRGKCRPIGLAEGACANFPEKPRFQSQIAVAERAIDRILEGWILVEVLGRIDDLRNNERRSSDKHLGLEFG
jgi:hypothetical protein